MKSRLSSNRTCIIICTCILGLPLWFYLCNMRINLSSSMPIGLYQLQPSHQIQKGDIVAVCLPDAIAEEGLAKGYLKSGQCHSGAMPILKQVIGLPGDSVTLNDNTTIINQQIFYTPRKLSDHQGRNIKQFYSQSHTTLQKAVWLYGNHNVMQSWDSRYFGPINMTNILGVFKPVMLFVRPSGLAKRLLNYIHHPIHHTKTG